MYDKGMRYFEDTPVADAEIDELDMDFVQEYTRKIGYCKTPLEYLKENKGFVREKNGNLLIKVQLPFCCLENILKLTIQEPE